MAFENLKRTGITYVLQKLKDYFLQIKDAVKTVNEVEPDENGNIQINTVPFAQNLESESSQRNIGVFVQRLSGGETSVQSGDAWLLSIKGNSVHDDYVPESIEMTITAVERENPITATLNRDTFVGVVQESGTTTLVYSGGWTADPSIYGITVEGTPVDGDIINVVYVKEERGHISVATPESMIATGWNLYNHVNGYARVVKYADGYRIDGTYTSLQYSATVDGTKSEIVVTDGNFDIPDDGFVWVNNGSANDTAIYPTWNDWTEGYDGEFESYSESNVDFSTVMTNYFPYGLLKAGSVVDEIDLNLGQAISRVERMEYSDANIALARNSGREFEYDENFIYLARSSAVVSNISVSGDFAVDDHGIEFFTNTDIPVEAQFLYGNNLKNKLERDVLTISSQALTSTQKSQVRNNLGLGNASTNAIANNLTTTASGSVLDARQGKVLNDALINVKSFSSTALSTQTSKITDRGSSVCKFGNLVLCCIECEVTEAITSSATLYNIPSAYRPSSTVGAFYAVGKTASGDIVPRTGSSFFTIASNGNMIQKWSASFTGWFSVIFIYSIS